MNTSFVQPQMLFKNPQQKQVNTKSLLFKLDTPKHAARPVCFGSDVKKKSQKLNLRPNIIIRRGRFIIQVYNECYSQFAQTMWGLKKATGRRNKKKKKKRKRRRRGVEESEIEKKSRTKKKNKKIKIKAIIMIIIIKNKRKMNKSQKNTWVYDALNTPAPDVPVQ